MSLGWQSISSSKLPVLYDSENSFPLSRSQAQFTGSNVKTPSSVDNYSTRVITKNGSVKFEKSSLPITIVEKAKENVKKIDASIGAEKIIGYNFANDHIQSPLFDTLSWTYDRNEHDKKKKKKKRHSKKHKNKFGHGHGSGHGDGHDQGSEEKYCNGKEHVQNSHKKYMMPMMIGVMTAKAVILPIVLKMLAMFSIKGFFLSILAIIISSVLALKKIAEPHHSNWEGNDHSGDTKIEVIPVPVQENYHHYTKHNEVVHDGHGHHPYKSYY